MHQRVAEFVDHPLVEFGLFARDLEGHAFAEFIGDVADRALEPVQERADRHHSRAENAPLQTVGHPGEMIDRLHQFGVATVSLLPHPALLLELFQMGLAGSSSPIDRARRRPHDRFHGLPERLPGAARPAAHRGLLEQRRHVGDELHEAGTADDQLADEIEQHIKAVDADPHRLHDGGRRLRRHGDRGCFMDLLDVEFDPNHPVYVGGDRDRAAGVGGAEHDIERPQGGGGGKVRSRRR